jgi:Domain of unknown function (DUF3597)
MSVLGNIISAIFGQQPKSAGGSTTVGSSATAPDPSTPTSATPQSQVDVEAVLNKLASQNTEKLDWRKSIVDLMKLLKLDSSLSARQALAKELHYPGDTKDSAAMNIWLHKQVMIKLAENGGKVPNELKS